MEISLTATSFVYSTLFTERLTALTIGLANSVTTMMRRERSLNDHTYKREIATVESRRDIHLFRDSIWARQGEQIDRIYLGTEGRWMIRLREELGGFKRMSGLGSCYGWGHHTGTCVHMGWWEVPIRGVKGYSHILSSPVMKPWWQIYYGKPSLYFPWVETESEGWSIWAEFLSLSVANMEWMFTL